MAGHHCCLAGRRIPFSQWLTPACASSTPHCWHASLSGGSGMARESYSAKPVSASTSGSSASSRSSFFAHKSPNPKPRASAAARSEAVARVYRSIMSRVDHPATAIRPPSEPPAASQRDAAVCRSRCG